MKRIAVFSTSAFLALAVVACSGPGKEGDTCRNTGDCGNGLQCRSNQCSISSFTLTTYTAECVVLECTVSSDCGGSQTCSSTGFCLCGADSDCYGGFCLDDLCVDCRDADDCPADYQCNEGYCQPECDDDAQCPAFNACESGKCSYVGCEQDRDCVRHLDDATARCDTSAEPPSCRRPCTTQFDCNTQGAHDYDAQTCSGGYCTRIGCESDAECHAEYGDTEYGVVCLEPEAWPASFDAPGAGGYGAANGAACQSAEDHINNLPCWTGAPVDFSCESVVAFDACDFTGFYHCYEAGAYCDVSGYPVFPTCDVPAC